MAAPVAGQEPHPDIADAPEQNFVGWRTPRGIDRDPLRVFKRIERVEAGATDDAYGPAVRGHLVVLGQLEQMLASESVNTFASRSAQHSCPAASAIKSCLISISA